MSKKRRIELPGNLGKLLIPKDSDVNKLREKYPEEKYTLTSVTADGNPLGFLLKKVEKKKAKPCKKCGTK